jgi:hypothetical protein
MPTWETPIYTEIKMDAEIGSYQVDDEEPLPVALERDEHTEPGAAG